MLRDDIIKVLEIVAVFLGENRADDVEVFSGELRVVHQLSLCSAGVHVAMHSVCQAMQQRLIELHESFMLSHRLHFIALYRRHNRWTWTMTEEQAVAEADDDFEALLRLVELEHQDDPRHQDGPPTRRAVRARVRLECGKEHKGPGVLKARVFCVPLSERRGSLRSMLYAFARYRYRT